MLKNWPFLNKFWHNRDVEVAKRIASMTGSVARMQGYAGKKKSGGAKRKKRSSTLKNWSRIGFKAKGSENFFPKLKKPPQRPGEKD